MSEVKPWFKAKSIGWGWGPALTWQGWAAYAVYLLLVVAGSLRFPPARDVSMFLVVTLLPTAALVALCWVKGEKPRWRDGRE